MARVLPHVMRNINEFNIPSGDTHGYEILYFGVNLILMFDYRLSFDVELKSANDGRNSRDNSRDNIQVIIISRKDVLAWKKSSGSNSSTQDIAKLHYFNSGQKINDIFRPSISDAYAFILSNRLSSNNGPKKVDVTLVHTWQQEIKESQLKDRV